MGKPLFDLGRTLATPGALAELEKAGVSPASLLARHVSGDRGTLSQGDKRANDEALIDGSRILSAYILQVRDHRCQGRGGAGRGPTGC
jgi:hypothetical protein